MLNLTMRYFIIFCLKKLFMQSKYLYATCRLQICECESRQLFRSAKCIAFRNVGFVLLILDATEKHVGNFKTSEIHKKTLKV